jgi:adenosylcobinamide-GDP ribazoletransferase
MNRHGDSQQRVAARAIGQAALVHTARAVRFFSRLPVPKLPWEDNPHVVPDFRALTRALPFAGLVIGLPGAAVLALALLLGLGPWLSAALGVAATTLVTGALHEDGLADTADGFGGGSTPERRLQIMKDSLIGSYGAAALILAFALRIGALATVADRLSLIQSAAAFLIAAVASRVAGLTVLTVLPPARREGASFSVGRPSRADLGLAVAATLVIAAALGLPASLHPFGVLLMLVLPMGAALLVVRASRRLIGGQTGDVVGTAQQLGEIAALIGLLTLVTP